jgi:hypothetical protein
MWLDHALFSIPLWISFERRRDLTILGRQRDDDGQNKLLRINGSKDNSSYIINRMNLVLEVEDMGFMVGKSSAEPSLKLHLLRLEVQPLYQDVWKSVIWRCKQSEDNACLNYSYIVIIQLFSSYLLYW